MVLVKIHEDENFESVLRRFKKQCQKAGIFSELKKRRFYEKPSVKRKKKSQLAQRKRNKWRRIETRLKH